MLLESETTVVSIGNEFQRLAEDVDSLLSKAASTLDSIEQGGVTSIPAKVRSLASASDQFIHKRFEATSAVLAAIKEEEALLERLCGLNSGIRSVAKETQMLGLLTGIEAARLGPPGVKFQYLSAELHSFADIVAHNSLELDGHATERRTAIQDSRRKLAGAMPRIRSEFARVDSTIARAIAEIEISAAELSASPAHFHSCLKSVAGQIAGVVSAIQSHDITRQQAEHVRDELDLFSKSAQNDPPAMGLPEAATRLTIQIFQLKNIKESMEAWIAQIDDCLGGLLGISCSELAKIGPLVLQQEQFLESQVMRIKGLEQECERDGEEVESALLDLSNLMKLIAETFKKSRVIRDRMQLLSFNSRIESNNSGSEAVVMIEISKNITRVAKDWAQMTERSERTMEEMLSRVVQAEAGMKALGHGGDGLEAAQVEIKDILSKLKRAAEVASGNASHIAAAVSALPAKIENIRSKAHLLSRMVGSVTEALEQVETVRGAMEADNPGVEMLLSCGAKLEQEFSVRYTTEIERQLLRAALFGDPMPTTQAVTAGNDVELF